jgi:hypothetical protein
MLQLETPMSRPVWAVLDAAGARKFTGEITLTLDPVVRVWFQSGEAYLALRDDSPGVAQLLLDYDVVTPAQLAQGVVRIGGVEHLGRLFERVPTVDRDRVELVLEIATAELFGEIADHVVDDIDVASYRHHPSGVAKWLRRTAPLDATADVNVAPDLPTGVIPVIVKNGPPPAPVDPFVPNPADELLVAEYEQAMAAGTLTIDTPPLLEPIASAIAETVEPVLASAATPEPVSVLGDVVFAEPTPVAIVEPVIEFASEPFVEPEAELAVDLEVELAVEPIVIGDLPVMPVAAEFDDSVFDANGRLRPVTFDLSAVLAEIVAEDTGSVAVTAADEPVDDDVKAAVREVLAEIEAATRPRAVDDLSPAAFAAALELAPESPADLAHSIDEPIAEPIAEAVALEPELAVVAGAAEPPIIRLPDKPVRPLGPATPAPAVLRTDPTGSLPAEQPQPGGGLRRLIGGRKP